MVPLSPIFRLAVTALATVFVPLASAQAETIRVAIGTQDTTINCATGGLLIRELKLLEKHLPKDKQYEIIWRNFTSGPPLTNEMVAGKLDLGHMADFPSALNGTAFQKAGGKSLYISTLSGNVKGGGNGLVVPHDSPINSLRELKGKQISVPFGSAAHGMLLRAIQDLGWDPEKDVVLSSQSPEIGGTSLKTNKIDAHANFVPFAELFPYRGFARKIYDGTFAGIPTSHGQLVNADYAARNPEVVVAFLKAQLEADALVDADPEKYSELIEKTTGIEAEVNYIFHGPLGIQRRDYTLKPEYREGLKIAVRTLKILKRTDVELDINAFVDDRFIREAAKQSKLDYDARLADYSPLPLAGPDALTGEPIADFRKAAQIWVKGEPKVRAYASIQNAFKALKALESEGRAIRAAYVHDRESGLKLFHEKAFFAWGADGEIAAFLLKESADAWSRQKNGSAGLLKDARAAASK